jgi:hypothetical protein
MTEGIQFVTHDCMCAFQVFPFHLRLCYSPIR